MPTYTLKDPVPSLVDRGYIQQGVAAYANTVCMFQASNNDMHVLVTFMGEYTSFHHINMTTGGHQIIAATGDYSGGFNAFAFDKPNGILYCLSHYGQGFLYKYNITTHAITQIAHETWPGQYAISKGSDNNIWIGWGDITGPVSSYNPSNDTYDNTWGPCDDTDCQYIQTIFADSTYIYAALRPAVMEDGYYLARITKSNNSVTLYFKGEGGTTCNVLAISDGTPYIERRDSTDTLKYYSLPNISEVSYPGALTSFPFQQCKYDNTANKTTWQNQYDYEIDLDYLLPLKDDQEYSEIKFRTPVGSGDFTTIQTTYTGPWRDEATMVILPLSGTQVACICGTLFLVNYISYDYSANTKTDLGQALLSIYDAKKHPSGDIYFFGYSATVERYDPDNPWTLVFSKYLPYLDSDGTKPNPYKITTGSITQNQNSFRGDYDKNNVVWFISNETRAGNDYGLLIWYDPSDGSNGGPADLNEIFNAGASKLRDIITSNSRSKIIVSAQDGKLYVVDSDTKLLESIITPTQNTNMFHAIIEAESGYLLLASIYIDPDTGPDETGNLNYFQKINISTGATVWSRSFGIAGKPFGLDGGNSSQRMIWYLRKGLDGYGWMFIGNSLYRINPAPNNGTVSKVADVTAGRLVWSDTDLIIYGQTHFFYYPGILTFEGYTRGAYSDLPNDNDDLSIAYDSSDVAKVATDDIDMVAQLATSQMAIHQFKKQITGKGGIIDAVAQVTIPCSTSTTYLQIYNRSGTPAWDTIDSDNSTGANTDFPLSATVDDLTDYKDENNIVACRVYQEMQ